MPSKTVSIGLVALAIMLPLISVGPAHAVIPTCPGKCVFLGNPQPISSCNQANILGYAGLFYSGGKWILTAIQVTPDGGAFSDFMVAFGIGLAAIVGVCGP